MFCNQQRKQGGISKKHSSEEFLKQLNADPAWANVKQYISSGYTFRGLRFKPERIIYEKRFVRTRTSETIVGTKGQRNLVATIKDGGEEWCFRGVLGNLDNQGEILDGRRNNRGRPRGASTAGGDRERSGHRDCKRQRTDNAGPGQVGLGWLVGGRGGEGVGGAQGRRGLDARYTGVGWSGTAGCRRNDVGLRSESCDLQGL